MPANADPPPFTSAPLHAVVADLVDESGVSQRDLVSRVGLSKDQLSRTLKGSRHMSLEEAATILHEAGLPARGLVSAFSGLLDALWHIPQRDRRA